MLALERTEDVLSALAATRRPEQVIVGFAAEHGEGALAYAREKLVRKRLDAIVVNDISRPDIGFDVGSNEVTVLTADGAERYLPRAAKELIADGILDAVEAVTAKEEERGDGARAGSGAPA